MNLHDETKPLVLDVVRTLLNVLPDGWTGATLAVREHAELDGTVRHRHSIRNTDGRTELAQPDDAVFDATWKLAEAFRAHQQPWESVEVTVRWLPETEKWDYDIAFAYAPAVRDSIAKRRPLPYGS